VVCLVLAALAVVNAVDVNNQMNDKRHQIEQDPDALNRRTSPVLHGVRQLHDALRGRCVRPGVDVPRHGADAAGVDRQRDTVQRCPQRLWRNRGLLRRA